MHAYIHAYVQFLYMYAYTFTRINTCMHACIYTYIHIHTCIHAYIHTYMHIYNYTYMRIYNYTYMHTIMLIHRYICPEKICLGLFVRREMPYTRKILNMKVHQLDFTQTSLCVCLIIDHVKKYEW